jgi:hypothetical protein
VPIAALKHVDLTPKRHIHGAERATVAAELVRRYAAGASIRKLTTDTGRSYGFVHRILTESGARLRRRGGTQRKRRPTGKEPARSRTAVTVGGRSRADGRDQTHITP